MQYPINVLRLDQLCDGVVFYHSYVFLSLNIQIREIVEKYYEH